MLLQCFLYYLHYLVLFTFSWFLCMLGTLNDLKSSVFHEDINKYFDYIIVGGGSAGAVTALRLSENRNVTVLLIEAGISIPTVLKIPVLGQLKQTSILDWHYKTVPQEHSCFGLTDNSSIWPAGKVLGGSTYLNYMIYLKGVNNDFLNWKDPESDEWSISDINYYFEKSRDCVYSDDEAFRKSSCNDRGSVLVNKASFTTDFSDAILRASAEIGHKLTDLNSNENSGFMKPHVNINRNGKRWTSEQKLSDVLNRRNNLKVLTNAVVERVLLRNGYEAYGIEYRRSGKIENIFANEEIILSAGAVGSAKILMLSGIGPKDVETKAKIEKNVDLPVGKNLQDHVTTGLDLIILNKTIFSISDLTNPRSAYEYFINGRGPFTSTMVDVVGLIHSSPENSNQKSPDLGFMVMMAGASSDGGLISKHSLGISDKIWKGYFALIPMGTAATILPVLLHPKSTGEVEINPDDPKGPPRINPRYLSNEDDVNTLIRGIRFIQKLINTKEMRNFGASFNNLTLPGCESSPFDSDDYWKCYIQHITLTSYHPLGTCKMGTANDSVVDYRLRVHKTNKLRVIDASIMPSMPSANTNAAVVMIAEKGADLLKEDYHNRRSRCSQRNLFLEERKCFKTKKRSRLESKISEKP